MTAVTVIALKYKGRLAEHIVRGPGGSSGAKGYQHQRLIGRMICVGAVRGWCQCALSRPHLERPLCGCALASERVSDDVDVSVEIWHQRRTCTDLVQ
jgi:hypothetical protein